MKKTIFLILTFLTTMASTAIGQLLKDSVTDIDGNLYHTVKIGKQVWMVENLKVTHYNNGDEIPNIIDSTQWRNLVIGAYCNYKNDTNIAQTYGRLYNWFAVKDKRNIAPEGWHVPTYEEWKKLMDYLGGRKSSISKLKEKGTIHWKYSDSTDTNKSGFTALPAGFRGSDQAATFDYIELESYWWCSSEQNKYFADDWSIYNTLSEFTGGHSASKNCGFSIRCLKNF